ncbi:MAG: hypothetical protein IJP48_08550 [Synergistaceae bacterium]|nr:hypothetical protein [Synergistaceae bacterium]
MSHETFHELLIQLLIHEALTHSLITKTNALEKFINESSSESTLKHRVSDTRRLH